MTEQRQDPSQRRQSTAGIVLLFGFVYIAFEFVAASAWTDPPYDWARNFISDLGFSDCAVVDGDRICSPLHALMNAGFFVQGTAFTIGSFLVAGLMVQSGWRRASVRVLLMTSGVGTFFVGVFHQSLALYAAGLNGLHITAATLAIGPGNVGLLLLGVFALGSRQWRWYGLAVSVIGVFGIIASLLLVAGDDLGIGIGFVERLAVYPLNVWTVSSGIGLVIKSVADRRARARSARGTTPA